LYVGKSVVVPTSLEELVAIDELKTGIGTTGDAVPDGTAGTGTTKAELVVVRVVEFEMTVTIGVIIG
jgi:hypothetical protein